MEGLPEGHEVEGPAHRLPLLEGADLDGQALGCGDGRHLIIGLDGEDVGTGSGELRCEDSGSGADIENAQDLSPRRFDWSTLTGLEDRRDEGCGIARPEPVIVLGHLAEGFRPTAVIEVRHDPSLIAIMSVWAQKSISSARGNSANVPPSSIGANSR